MSDDITLAHICDEATEEGGWIEAPFEAIVRNAKARKGKAPSKCDLVDPQNPHVKVEAAYFGGSFLDYEGSVVRFSGKGRKAKLFDGNVEITLYDKATITVIGDAPASTRAASTPRPAAAHEPGPDAGKTQAGAEKATRPKEEPVVHFHKEMKKTALLWLHCFQYAAETEGKLKAIMPKELFQSLVSSLFITAKDRGLLERPPAPRGYDDKGMPLPFVPPAPDPAALEAAAKAREAAAKKAAEEELRRHQEENTDEDVPF